MFLCAVGVYISEVGVNPGIQSPLDALWWGLTTMTTVGYGDIALVTGEGRLSAAVLLILGIGLYSAITARMTSFLVTGDSIRTLPANSSDLRNSVWMVVSARPSSKQP